MRYTTVIMAVAATALSGCGTLMLSPIANESRVVQTLTDATKTLTVPEGMVFYDSRPPTQGIRFPAGTYAVEAEDADFWYLRSEAPLEFRDFDRGAVVAERTVPGGIMIAKRFSMVPAAGYTDQGTGTKLMIWKLGQEFLMQEGKSWTKTF
jgi:hypothetical protein